MEDQGEQVDYSVIVPVYYNEGSLKPTIRRLKSDVFEKNPDRSYEVIFVDDGSGDGSLGELLEIRDEHENCKIIKLTRNFGQVNALLAGFRESKGDCVVAISADGQDPTELISKMLEEFFNHQAEIVVAYREDREDGFLRKITSKIFYKLMQRLSFPEMPSGGFDFFLLGRRPLEAILETEESHAFLQGQILWTGYSVKFLSYKRKERDTGKSRWTLGKKLTYLLDGVMGYSFLPIRSMSVMGVLVALSGFFYAIVIFLERVIWGNPVQGWAPLMIVLLVVSGIQLIMLGMIGEYLWRTLAQTRRRQAYLIDEIYE